MKRPAWCMPIILCCLHAACGESVGDGLIVPARSFDKQLVLLRADSHVPVAGRTTTITLFCYPLITGKGYITLHGWGNSNGVSLIYDSPVQDTLVSGDNDSAGVSVPVDFVANQLFTQQWKVRPTTSDNEYYFQVHARFDSVFIADSARMYWIYSTVVKEHSPTGLGFLPYAGEDATLILRP